jgi:hypothetical protein
MFMPKKGISVTLQDDNLLWLKGRTVAVKGRSLSETLDDLVTAARTGGTSLRARFALSPAPSTLRPTIRGSRTPMNIFGTW